MDEHQTDMCVCMHVYRDSNLRCRPKPQACSPETESTDLNEKHSLKFVLEIFKVLTDLNEKHWLKFVPEIFKVFLDDLKIPYIVRHFIYSTIDWSYWI